MLKKIIRNTLIKSFLSWLISVYLKLCYHTSIWLIKDNQNIAKLIEANKSFIVCFWHGRLLMTPFCWNYEKKFFMLISGHPDGQIISKAVSYFGIKTIVGSSFNNKFKSLKSILKEIKSNNNIVMKIVQNIYNFDICTILVHELFSINLLNPYKSITYRRRKCLTKLS